MFIILQITYYCWKCKLRINMIQGQESVEHCFGKNIFSTFCWGLFILCIRKIFQKVNNSYTVISTGTCTYQGLRNFSLFENFLHALNGSCLKIMRRENIKSWISLPQWLPDSFPKTFFSLRKTSLSSEGLSSNDWKKSLLNAIPKSSNTVETLEQPKSK